VSLRSLVMNRLTALTTERSTWLAHWQDISDFIYPRRFRYLTTERNKGTKRNDKIINNKATLSARVLMSGMQAGLTSPTRPWVRMLPVDLVLLLIPRVTDWLEIVEKTVYQVLARSNIYNCLHEMYGIEGTFATAAMYVEEDAEDDVRGYVLPVGQFLIASSFRQQVDTLYRDFGMTVGQLVSKFGINKVTINTRQRYERGDLDGYVDVVHAVEPRAVRDLTKLDNLNMEWQSVWMEKAAPAEWPPLLVSGYEEFPYMVARWFVTGEDTYGSGSPGMDCLGDAKAIQTLERRKAQAIDKIVNPPMKAPMSLKASRVSLLPGDTNYVPDNVAGQMFEPVVKIDPSVVTVAESSIREHEGRIKDTFYTSLFLAMLEDDRQQPITAREVNERHEEKMLQLGPTVERNEDELLSPLLNRIVQILARKGRIPPPPPELAGGRVKLEYISIMAQAQKLLATSATERFISFVGSTSAINKGVLDVPNFDKILRKYAEMLGMEPDDLNPEEVVAALRKQAAAQAQMQQAAQASTVMAQNAKVASETDMSGDSALSRLMNTVGGGGGPLARA